MSSSRRPHSGRLFLLTALSLFAFLVSSIQEQACAQGESQAQSEQTKSQSQKPPNNKTPSSKSQNSKPEKKGAKSSSAVDAMVKTDGAIVYSRPDFDADVIANLRKGDVVRASKGTVGDQYGRFHKVKVGDKIGYVADIDVAVEGGAQSVAKKKHSAKKNSPEAEKKETAPAQKEEQRRQNQLPMYFSRYFGFIIGQSGYKESISGVDATTNFLVYGIKVTGPDVLIAGPVIDFNLLLHYGAPDYYEKLSTAKPSGYVLLTDALLMVPFVQMHNAVFYLEAGPLLAVSNIKTVTGGNPRDLTSVNIGASFALGGAVRIEKVALRLEAKHFWEKQSYQALQFAVQTEL